MIQESASLDLHPPPPPSLLLLIPFFSEGSSFRFCIHSLAWIVPSFPLTSKRRLKCLRTLLSLLILTQTLYRKGSKRAVYQNITGSSVVVVQHKNDRSERKYVRRRKREEWSLRSQMLPFDSRNANVAQTKTQLKNEKKERGNSVAHDVEEKSAFDHTSFSFPSSPGKRVRDRQGKKECKRDSLSLPHPKPPTSHPSACFSLLSLHSSLRYVNRCNNY